MHIPNTIRERINNLQYFIILAIVLILPYWEWFKFFKPLTFILLFTTIIMGQFDYKNILKDKVFISLSIFILFTFSSIFWTEADPVFTPEFNVNFDRFKYYFLLIPAIYSASLNTQKIKNVFYFMALSPLGIIAIYYLNALDITHIYSYVRGKGDSHLIIHHLINNFFILFGAIYFYIMIFENFIKNQYKKSIVYSVVTLVYFVSMFVESYTTARLIILAFFIIVLVVPLFYLKRKHSMIIIIVSLILISVYINTNTRMQNGISTFKTAIQEDRYTGSWGHRLGFAIVGIKLFQENPIIGRGICDVRDRTIAFDKEEPKYFKGDVSLHFHNAHINTLVQVGLVGYSLFIIFIALFLKDPIQDSFVKKIKYSFIISFLFLMFGEHYLSIPTTTSFFALFVGLMLLYKKQESIELKNADT